MHYSLAHGHWKIYIHQKTLVIHTAGAWNRSAMEMFCDEIKSTAQTLIEGQRPWSSLILLDDYELGVPDIEPLLQSLLQHLVERGLTREAAVFNGGFARMEQMARNLPADSPQYIRQNFNCVEDAGSWLQQQGFPLDIEIIHQEYTNWRG